MYYSAVVVATVDSAVVITGVEADQLDRACGRVAPPSEAVNPLVATSSSGHRGGGSMSSLRVGSDKPVSSVTVLSSEPTTKVDYKSSNHVNDE